MPTPNELGPYGQFADRLLKSHPQPLSLRSGQFKSKSLAAWRTAARRRVSELLAAPPMPRTPRVRIEETGTYEDLYFERLSWQLPYGPRTSAVLLKPAAAPRRARLPGFIALHDHGGMKHFGWQKIARISHEQHPMLRDIRAGYYGGRAWVNEIARLGYIVLCHDAFIFGSRRVRIADCLPEIARGVVDPGPIDDPEEITAYNNWAGGHEHLVAKSLFSAGTTWPGVFLSEDQVALSILAARKDVDPKRLGTGGLSGGGLRACFLAGMDDRVQSAFAAGFYTTSRDLTLFKAHSHTWMTFLPLAARELDFADILTLRAPKPTMVLHSTDDSLFTNAEVTRAAAMAKKTYKIAKAPKNFQFWSAPGPHQFNLPMQKAALDFVGQTLKP